jgi:hypothetical protein
MDGSSLILLAASDPRKLISAAKDGILFLFFGLLPHFPQPEH